MFRLQCSTDPVEEAGDRCFPLISKSWCEWKGFVLHYLLFVQRATSEHRLGAHPPRPGLCPFQPRSTSALARSWLLGDLLLRSGGPASFALSSLWVRRILCFPRPRMTLSGFGVWLQNDHCPAPGTPGHSASRPTPPASLRSRGRQWPGAPVWCL